MAYPANSTHVPIISTSKTQSSRQEIEAIERAIIRGNDIAMGLVLLSSEDWGNSPLKWDMMRNAVQGMAQTLEELFSAALEPVSNLKPVGAA